MRRFVLAIFAAVLMVTALAPSPASAAAGATKNPIEGRVSSDHTGAKLPGICVAATSVNVWPARSYETTTNALGLYKLLVPDGTYKVSFRDCSGSPVYLPQWWANARSAAAATPITVGGALTAAQLSINAALIPGATLTGIVTGGDNGAPLAGICIKADRPGEPSRSVVTADDGSYSLVLSDGTWGVGFLDCRVHPEYLTAATDVHIDGEQAGTVAVNMAMQRGGSVSGQVTDDVTGLPVSDICVMSGSSDLEKTDATGHYTVTGVPSGDQFVHFTDCTGDFSPGHLYAQEYFHHTAALREATLVPVHAPNNTAVDETLIHAGSITGTVTDAASGLPLSDIVVFVWHDGSNVQSASTASDGTYALEGLLPEQDYTVEFLQTSNRYVTQWWNGQVSQDQAQPVAVNAGSTTAGIDAAMQPS